MTRPSHPAALLPAACLLLTAWLVVAGPGRADYGAAEAALAAGDFERVLAELRVPAASDDARALNLLGVLNQNGWGVPRDPVRAAELFGRAAALGLTRATHNLGRLYRSGLGVTRDDEEAARLWKLAGREGYLPSQASLGALYYDRAGVHQDLFRAYFWWSIAARRLDLESVRAREDIIYRLTAHEKAVADRLVEQFEPDR